jgi:hypothetical protein
MITPKYRAMFFAGFTLVSTALQSSPGLAFGGKPPIENIQNARLIVYSAVARVDALIQQVLGGGGQRPGDEWPAPHPYPGEGSEYPGGSYPRGDYPQGDYPRGEEVPPYGSYPRMHRIVAGEGEVGVDDELENDRIAGFALQGLGVGLRNLGELIDQANANYYSPAFGLYWKKVCMKAAFLIKGTRGGKVSAALPPQGMITPQDFALTEQELMDVRNQFYCF